MPYILMFLMALLLHNVFEMSLIAAALVSALGWGLLGVLVSAVRGAAPESGPAPASPEGGSDSGEAGGLALTGNGGMSTTSEGAGPDAHLR